MPFEVYPIKPPDSESMTIESLHGPNSVAQDIKDVYTKVAEQGGKIIAEHHLTHGGDRAYGLADKHWLFLVADIPESNPE